MRCAYEFVVTTRLRRQRVLPGTRVIHFWDDDALTSDWFASEVDHSVGPAWDVYYLYSPEAKWSSIPKPLVSSGGTVIGQSAALKEAITPLLQGAHAGTG